jgi:hypothetical protein
MSTILKDETGGQRAHAETAFQGTDGTQSGAKREDATKRVHGGRIWTEDGLRWREHMWENEQVNQFTDAAAAAALEERPNL